jgi:hypothetical protein
MWATGLAPILQVTSEVRLGLLDPVSQFRATADGQRNPRYEPSLITSQEQAGIAHLFRGALTTCLLPVGNQVSHLLRTCYRRR